MRLAVCVKRPAFSADEVSNLVGDEFSLIKVESGKLRIESGIQFAVVSYR
jgi:hypothetical protein